MLNIKIWPFALTILLFIAIGSSVAQGYFIEAKNIRENNSELTADSNSLKRYKNRNHILIHEIEKKENESGSLPLRLKQKLVPLHHSVYKLLDLYESTGVLGFLPRSKPYTRQFIVDCLEKLQEDKNLSESEMKIITQYLEDYVDPFNGLKIKEHNQDNFYTFVGARADITGRIAGGDNATYSTSNIIEPFLGGELGKHLSYFAGIGAAAERLAPDLFFESYVKNKEVNFPYQDKGYAFHPYQFGFETMWEHVNASANQGEGPPIQSGLTAGMIYHTELSGSWANNSVQIHLHNLRRSWGYTNDNLVLSEKARRFPGIDLMIQPTQWLRYSFLTGSLFHYPAQRSNYKENIYNYDLGQVQKMLTLHQLEFTPTTYLNFTFTGGNIWSKRLELAYLIPFVLPHLTQIDIGDHDNLSMELAVSLLLPGAGKYWFNFFVDEFSFTETTNLLKMPRNRYAWQLGWNTGILSQIIPGTSTRLSVTRVTPFVYTHYPETDFNTFGNRPLDMTYSHDGFNLGFYLPPNSAEFEMSFTNFALPDVVLELQNKFIMHGTNDLDGPQYQIFGDIYRHQMGNVYDYPLLNFPNDGIYDYTWYTELKMDKKIRFLSYLNYFRLIGKVGISHTWWENNNSNVTAPENQTLFTVELGTVIDF